MNRALVLAAIGGAMFVSQAATAKESYCREYTKEMKVNGKRQTAYGTACRQPDGAWKIVSGDDILMQDNVKTVVIREREVEPPRTVISINTGRPFYRSRYRHHHWRSSPFFRSSYGWGRDSGHYSRQNRHYSRRHHRHHH